MKSHKGIGVMTSAFVFASSLSVTASASQPTPEAPESTEAVGLQSLFTPGKVFQDRNRDGVVDWVDASVVVGEAPSPAEVASAANVAARLGYETMAMNLPLSHSPEGAAVAFLVGASAVARGGLSEDEAGLSNLSPGEGTVRYLAKDDREWVVVAGKDDEGTRAAAMAFAGYLPHLGDPKGATLDEVLDAAKELLEGRDVTVQSMRVDSINATAGAEPFSRLAVVVGLSSASDSRKARDAFTAVARGRARTAEEQPLAYDGARTLRFTLLAPSGPPTTVEVPSAPAETEGGPIPARPGAGAKTGLDLSNLYQNDGLLGDSDRNVIPDRIDAVLSPTGEAAEATIDLAARLALESTGVALPLAKPPDAIADPKEEPTLVLIGVDHPLTRKLVEDEKLELPSLSPGEGYVQVVPKSFGRKSALVVTGGDEKGLSRALEQIADRFPNVWERGKDRTSLDDVEMDLWRFFSERTPAGQAAGALYKLDQIVKDLSTKSLASARVLVSLEKPDDGLEAAIRRRAQALGAANLDVVIDNRDVQHAKSIMDDEIEIPSEVDAMWNVFHTRVLPKVRKGRPLSIEVRVSEPPEIRSAIESQMRGELQKKGARDGDVDLRVLSAYKQGYSWLYDAIRPKLQNRSIGEVVIRFAELGPPADWEQQAIYTPIRWLKEIFPIDEVLAKELSLDRTKIRFEMAPKDSVAYEVVATDSGGAEILRETFEPKYILMPYHKRFRDYEMIRVTTGWIHAKQRDEILADERIMTDVERLWQHYQDETLPAVYDYIMKLHDGNPRGNGKDAPYFGTLQVEASLSEPDYPIGVEREIISPMDALHEDLYFGTLWFFRLLGRNARGEELSYVGRIIPVMRPKSDGKAGWAKISLTGFATSRPAVVVDYEETSGEKGQARLDIPQIDIDRPQALAAWVRDGRDGLEGLKVRVRVNSREDQREDLVLKQRAIDVDEEVLSADQVTAMLGNLHQLRSEGLYRGALSYHDLGRLEVTAGWEFDVDPESEVMAELEPNGTAAPYPDIRKLLPAGYEYHGENLVQWDTPIPPPEAYGILAKMSTFPEATVYKAGESYLGKDIWAMDLMPPIEASHWSAAKATTFKPTVINSGRQHANEVSSTSHILKWAEMLLTDPEYKKHLDKVNVVIHPVTNPDGAQLAYDLSQITPEFILHAGYLGSLGMDVESDTTQPMPMYPESTIRRSLWREWLPDIFLNPHGYPSHQVVQLFSEFDGLVRRGRVTERNWSMNKGWFIPGFGYFDDPELPRHKEAALEIRKLITEGINAAPDVYAMNQRNYDRYRRYGAQFDKEAYKLDMTNDVLIYMPLEGARAERSGGGRRRGGYDPRVTIWSGGTEAPDETAHGDWMKLVATAGLQWDKAILKYLVEGNHKVERTGSNFWGGVSLKVNRERPPRPNEGEKEGESSRPTSDPGAK